MGSVLPFEWISHDFMKRAFIAILFMAPAAAAVGIHVVNFRMSFFSDAISHSAFTGVAIGIVAGIDPVYTLVLFGLLVGGLIVKMRKKSDLSVDAIIGVAFSTSVALGIVIISAKRGLTRNLHSFIYGDLLTVTEAELLLMSFLATVVFLFSVFMYNRLILIAVSEEVSRTKGINTVIHEYLFAILLALVVCLSIRVVGILLVTAMIIIPATIGRTLSKSVGALFWISILTAIVSSLAGLISSYYWDTSTGATVVLSSAAFFFAAQIVKGLQRR